MATLAPYSKRIGFGASMRLLQMIREAFAADEESRKAMVATAIRLDRRGELTKVMNRNG